MIIPELGPLSFHSSNPPELAPVTADCVFDTILAQEGYLDAEYGYTSKRVRINTPTLLEHHWQRGVPEALFSYQKPASLHRPQEQAENQCKVGFTAILACIAVRLIQRDHWAVDRVSEF